MSIRFKHPTAIHLYIRRFSNEQSRTQQSTMVEMFICVLRHVTLHSAVPSIQNVTLCELFT